jgi:hypothetical protein
MVSGVREAQHLENLKEEAMARRSFQPYILSIGHLAEAKVTLLFTLVVTLIIALAIVVAGCVLVYLGATGHTELDMFGTKVSTASVGVVGIVCGTLLAIMNTRRLLKAVERLAALPPDAERAKG